MMKSQLQRVVVLGALALACCSAQHVELPEETNVESPSFCQTNSDGFGGRPIGQGSSVELSENTYFYELTINGDDVDSAISDVETRIADYLLAETGFFDICSRRLLKKKRGLRKLQEGGAVAITTNPDDYQFDDGRLTR